MRSAHDACYGEVDLVTVLMVLLGGAVGAPLRYVTDQLVQARHDSVFPWGTLAVNVVGSLVLGMVAAGAATAGLPGWVLALVGTGICGALTTFSTFGYETIRLIEDGSVLVAVTNCLTSLALGLVAFAGGWALVTLL